MREKKILVIDDDEMNLQIAKMVLEKKLACEVVCASSGIDGLEILRSQRINLALLDIMMPDFDGIETLKEIRGDERIKNVPVMMLTASGDVENIHKVGALGVKDYIKKPFMPADLIKRVEKKLSEIHLEEVLIIGDDEEELRGMKEIIEENFPHEALTAANFDAATKILREMDFDLLIACADMKLVDGFKIMKFISSDEKFSAIPFAITTSDKLLEVVEKINQPEVEEIESLTEEIAETDAPTIEKLPVEEKASAEEKIADDSPSLAKKADDSPVIHSDKKKIANVVTTLIGYELDIHI